MGEESNPFLEIDSPEKLRELQRIFAEIIRVPLKEGEKMVPDERTESFIQGNELLVPHERLELYAQQYWWRLIGTLKNDFPITLKILGEERFRKLSEAYLTECPSISFTLRHLGERLSDYIRDNPTLTEPLTDVLADAVKLEYAIDDVFCAGNCEPISLNDLQSDPSELRLSLKPALKLLQLDHQVHKLIEAARLARRKGRGDASNVLTQEDSSESKALAEQEVDIESLKANTFLVVHRLELSVYFKEQSETEFRILEALNSGETLESALEKTLPHEEGFDLGKAFQDWVSLGWLCKHQ